MTTARSLFRQAIVLVRAAGARLGVILAFLVPSVQLAAQGPKVHWQHAGAMPPGAIGTVRLGRGGPLSGYFQPVSIRAPAGAKVALSADGCFQPPQPSSVMAGLLVGSVYRFRITEIPNHVGMELFPTVELIDRLYPPPGQALRFPVPIQITQQDLQLALDGVFVTRVVYVEDPEMALPHAQPYDELSWFDVRAGEHPLELADKLGRPVAIVRLGGRLPGPNGPDENFLAGSPPLIQFETTAGEPEERHHAPCHESSCPANVSDPWRPPGIQGPWPPDEYLCDGGDRGLQTIVRADWSVDGVDPEDALAHYDTLDGRTVVEPSSRICIYAPRFAAVRSVENALIHEAHRRAGDVHLPQEAYRQDALSGAKTALQRLGPNRKRGTRAGSVLRGRQQGGELENPQRLASADGTLRPQEDIQRDEAYRAEQLDKARLAQAVDRPIVWTHDLAVQILIDGHAATIAQRASRAEAVYSVDQPDRPRLRVIKCASSDSARAGETIDFTIRYQNIGNQTIGNVTIIDNLTTRFEYVPDSAQSSAPADFSSAANQSDSLTLRWEIRDPLPPGKGGLVRFRCKVR